MSDDAMDVEKLLEERRRVLGVLVREVGLDLGRRPAGRLGAEIAAQVEGGSWARSATPLQSGWHAAMRNVACACGHAEVALSVAATEGAAVTADLLVRAAFENLAIACWLLGPDADGVERSRRALAEVSASTSSLKKFYRAQGSVVDEDRGQLGERGQAIRGANELLVADYVRVTGVSKVTERPSFTTLVDEDLFGLDGGDPGGGALYRLLSGSAHGNKWAQERHTDSPDADGRVGFTATAQHSEMLLFYLGIALLKVVACCSAQLDWPHYGDRGGADFLGLGPCLVDVGG